MRTTLRSAFWFLAGICLGLFFLGSLAIIFFQRTYKNTVYPGVTVHGIDFGRKSQQEVEAFFEEKNEKIATVQFTFSDGENSATASARELGIGYDADLLARQALSVGRSGDTLANISLITQAYVNGVYLSPSYRFSDSELMELLNPTLQALYTPPMDALFAFQGGKVIAFRPSQDGQEVAMDLLKKELQKKIPSVVEAQQERHVHIAIPIRVLKPKVTTEEANSLGIRELIATGTSLFQGSIPNRIFNITLAAERLNGILVAPNEVFSFNKALGDVSAFTGYKQAYVIQGGKTILGDGGGVCQVSTTLFRSLLNAGLPIMQRHAHSYRVGYYEQDSPPGFDATVYAPLVDLRFKNDTGNHILIQSDVDPITQRLTFSLYGTKDERAVTIAKPTITNQTPAPEPIYQDDPTLPKGTVKQVDFAAAGATVSFTRQVTKNGKVIISDKFVSNFRPWQAVYLRGTQE